MAENYVKKPPKPVTTVDKPAEPTPPIKPTPITPKPKPTQPTNPTTYHPNESGIEGKTAGEVTNYKTRLLEWKKKIEVEERRKEGSPSRRKKVKHPEDITKAKTVKHTTWKKGKPAGIVKLTGQPAITSFLASMTEGSNLKCQSEECSSQAVTFSKTLVGTKTTEAEKQKGDPDNTARDMGHKN